MLRFLMFCGQWRHVESGSNKHGFIAFKAVSLSYFNGKIICVHPFYIHAPVKRAGRIF